MFLRVGIRYVVAAVAAIFVVFVVLCWLGLRPAEGNGAPEVIFKVSSGEGFLEITNDLASQGLIRSRIAFETWVLVSGTAGSLQPGLYRLTSAMSGVEISHLLVGRGAGSVSVTIPEGSNIFQIDRILSGALVAQPGSFVQATIHGRLEGRLFPDTYQFTDGEAMSDILKTFADDFASKADPLFAKQPETETSTLTIASMLEKEARDPADQRIIAGIIAKRIKAGMSLDVDATVCYGKQIANPDRVIDCATLTRPDFAVDSPYNTYLHHGLPPTPIGNPGTSSIVAALNPVATSYWYYLSDSATGKIFYAKTLDEQTANIKKYLK